VSHTVKVSVELRDREVLELARERCKLPAFKEGRHDLFQGQHKGLALQLPGWSYPVVIKPESGEAVYDNYGEKWGKQVELDRLCQAYALEAGTREFQRQGFEVLEEQPQATGDVRLVATAY